MDQALFPHVAQILSSMASPQADQLPVFKAQVADLYKKIEERQKAIEQLPHLDRSPQALEQMLEQLQKTCQEKE